MTQNTKLAVLDADSYPVAFYDKKVHGDKVPKDAVEITDAQWVEFINNDGTRKLDSGKIVKSDHKAAVFTWEDIRLIRNNFLKACDWTQLEDSPLNAAQKTKWAEYRKALRDIPKDFKDPSAVTFPDAPA